MLIGEVAERSGVPAKTLRYYEDIGILPAPERRPSGYRDYRDDTLDRLGFIGSAKAAGLTLAEIRNVIALRDGGIAPCSHVAAVLDEKAAAVSRQIDELRRLQQELNRLRKRARLVDPGECDPSRICDVIVGDDTFGQ